MTRFMLSDKDRIDRDDVFKFTTSLVKPVTVYDEPTSLKTYQIDCNLKHKASIQVLIKLGDSQTMKLIDSCLLYVNEDIEIKRLVSVWMSENHSELKVVHSGKQLLLDVFVKNRMSFTKKISVIFQRTLNNSITIGKKDLTNDYGIHKQYEFLLNLFKFDILNEKVVDNYKHIADNDSNPSHESIFEATKYLYSCLSKELNKTLPHDSGMINMISDGVKEIINGENFQENEVLRFDKDYQIEKIDYERMKNSLMDSDIYTTVRDTKSPILAIMSKKENRELFRIRTRREKYLNSITENRYKVYFEASNSFLDNVLTKL